MRNSNPAPSSFKFPPSKLHTTCFKFWVTTDIGTQKIISPRNIFINIWSTSALASYRYNLVILAHRGKFKDHPTNKKCGSITRMGFHSVIKWSAQSPLSSTIVNTIWFLCFVMRRHSFAGSIVNECRLFHQDVLKMPISSELVREQWSSEENTAESRMCFKVTNDWLPCWSRGWL